MWNWFTAMGQGMQHGIQAEFKPSGQTLGTTLQAGETPRDTARVHSAHTKVDKNENKIVTHTL